MMSMRKLALMIFVSLVAIFTVQAETGLRGIVRVAGTGAPISGVVVTLLKQNISTQTNQKGEFLLTYIEAGKEEVSFSKVGYFSTIKLINLKANQLNEIEVVELKQDVQSEVKREIVLQLSENELDNDDSRTTQSMSGVLSSRGDVYTAQTNFSFSPMRFQNRGYDQNFESTYINGVSFNGLERDNFNYSSLGGLNDAFRNQDAFYGVSANSFSYGNLGNTSNVNVRATQFAHGSKASIAATDRSYKLRGQYTYGTGLLDNGWAFAASAVVRWADKGKVQGSFYNSAAYFLSLEKIINEHHSISLVTYGSPTQRTQQSAVTKEVTDLTGSIYYNPYWGYQNGKERNSRIVKSFAPTAILSHDFKINDQSGLKTGLSYQYSLYSTSALSFYNAPDPRPDYYRNMPSFQSDDASASVISDLWKNNTAVSQINWDALYMANYRNNAINPNGIAKYAVERRHRNLSEIGLNSTYTNQLLKEMKLTAGIEGKLSKSMNYKTMEDLLGANQWIDIDQFAERDFPSNPNVIQNDMNNPNRIIHEGDKFGYNYDLNIRRASAFVQNEWNLQQFDLYYAAKLTYTDFYRYGHMLNGRAEAIGAGSYGKGKEWFTTNPSIKAGLTYKIDARNRLYANVVAETRAPQIDNSYVSIRIKDTAVPLANQKVFSYDLNYAFNYSSIRGRISGFRTAVKNSSDLYGYYDDENQTFVNFMLSGLDKLYQGIEAGLSIQLNKSFKLAMAGTLSEYKYTSNSTGIKSYENGKFEDSQERVNTKDLHIATGPQMAGNTTLSYFHPKMWFVDLTLSYFDNNYLDFAPSRFTDSNMALYSTKEIKDALGTQEKLKGGFLLDASVGKVFYLKNRKSLNFNLSMSNILNNTSMVTGGFQQARVPLNNGAINTSGLNYFANKYYYAMGFNFFFNVGFKF